MDCRKWLRVLCHILPTPYDSLPSPMGVPPENEVVKSIKSGKDMGRGSKKKRLSRFVLDFGKNRKSVLKSEVLKTIM